MHTLSAFLCAVAVLLAVAPGETAAQTDSTTRVARDSVKQRIAVERIAARDTTAGRLFEEATRAFDADRLIEARAKFEATLNILPDCDDAYRRLSYVESKAGNSIRAVALADSACRLDSSAYNRTAVAIAVADAGVEARYNDALNCAWRAAADMPNDTLINFALLNAGYLSGNTAALRQASEKLMKLMPEFPQAHFFNGLLLADDAHWMAAEEELLLSKELGMSAKVVDDALASGIGSKARSWRWGARGLYFVGAWAAVLVLLFAIGGVLSTLTMRAVRRTQATGVFVSGGAEASIRNVYRALIAITARYFYISLPVMFGVVLAGGGLLLYAMFALGHVPIKLAAFIAIGTLITLYAIIRSAFAQSKEGDPGRALKHEEAPHLWRLTEEVAAKAETRPIDAIFVTPGAEIAVYEKKSSPGKSRGESQRCLILGMAALRSMQVGPFKSILAHEYGHFSNRDTAGGNLAHQTNLSIRQMAITLAANGLATWYNPAWWFIRGFNAVYMRITLGASRLQEILADRIAGMAYGARNFVTGLTHVIRQSLEFDRQVGEAMQRGREQFARLTNLYTLPEPTLADGGSIIEVELKKALQRPTSVYDSHPAPCARFALLEKLGLSDLGTTDEGEVLHLFNDPVGLQREMTNVIHRNLGITPPEAEPESRMEETQEVG